MNQLLLFLQRLSFTRSAGGWCRRLSWVLVGLFSLVSSPVMAAAPVINSLSTSSKTQLEGYSGAVIGLVAGFVALGLLCFIAYSLFQVINKRSD